jgi:hypothetical protein
MRKQDWEKRLAAYLDHERNTPFVWGHNDCMAFSAKAAILILERDVSSQLKDYSATDEKTANDVIEKYGSIGAIFDRHYKRRVNWKSIKRGDICTVDFYGTIAAGVLDTTGRKIACKTLAGLVFVPISKITAVWDIETCRH